MTTAKIKEIKNVREWTGDKGTVFYFEVVMDNGDAGSIGKKSKDALAVGKELTYTVEANDKGNRLKEVQQNGGNGFRGFGAAQRNPCASFALAYSKDLVIAQINAGKTGDLKTQDLADAIITVAAKFNDWMKEHE